MQVVPHIIAPAGPAFPAHGLAAGPGSPRPANPDHEPIPGGNIPTEVPPTSPDELPDTGPTGPRTPYPVNDPGISEPIGPGSEPDYLPGKPTSPMQLGPMRL